MTSRTSLPPTLTSPILQKSSEGVSFRTPASGQRSSPVLSAPTVSQNTSFGQTYASPNLRSPSPPTTSIESNTCTSGGGSINMVVGSVVVIAFIFVAIFVILYASSLNMVTDLIDGERVMNLRKVFLWTFVLGSLLILALFVGYRSLR